MRVAWLDVGWRRGRRELPVGCGGPSHSRRLEPAPNLGEGLQLQINRYNPILNSNEIAETAWSYHPISQPTFRQCVRQKPLHIIECSSSIAR